MYYKNCLDDQYSDANIFGKCFFVKPVQQPFSFGMHGVFLIKIITIKIKWFTLRLLIDIFKFLFNAILTRIWVFQVCQRTTSVPNVVLVANRKIIGEKLFSLSHKSTFFSQKKTLISVFVESVMTSSRFLIPFEVSVTGSTLVIIPRTSKSNQTNFDLLTSIQNCNRSF